MSEFESRFHGKCKKLESFSEQDKMVTLAFVWLFYGL